MSHHRAKKSLGQNFLVDGNYQSRIAHAVLKSSPQTILEIGPGQGAITHKIFSVLERTFGVVQFVAVEKDSLLVHQLQADFLSEPTFRVIEADFLEWEIDDKLLAPPTAVIGNLPYNVSSQIFIKLIKNRKFFSNLFLMFQKEVAERMVAKPKTKDFGLLSLWAQIYSKPKILFHLPPSVFRPRPRVDSSFVQFEFLEKPLVDAALDDFFWEVVPLMYQHRRKMIASSLNVQNKIQFDREKLKSMAFASKRIEEFNPTETVELVRSLKDCLL